LVAEERQVTLEPLGTKEPLYELIDVPEHFGPIQRLVDDHKIKTYAFTQDDYNSWYFGDDNPFGRRIGHAAILANDVLQLFTTLYDPSAVVGFHTHEELWFHNPVFEGEVATLEGAYVEKYERRGKGYVVMEAEARGEDGRLLITHRGEEIMRIHPGSVRGQKVSEKEETSNGGKSEERGRVSGEYRKDIEPVAQARRDLEPGTPIAPLRKHTIQEQVSIFSRAGRFIKNIHSDIDVAREAGLEVPIVQGQQQLGYLTEMLTNFFGASWFTSGWVKVKFIGSVDVGETVTARGAVTGAAQEEGRTRLELEVWVETESGDMTTVGWASALVDEV